MAVVKANAYGHGAVECSRALESDGVDWLCVALPEEALELRKANIQLPLLCLGSFWEGQESLLLRESITPVIFDLRRARLLDQSARERGVIASAHVKIDTGMGRVGIRHDEITGFVDEISKLKNIRIEGLMTHFAAADDLEQTHFTQQQARRFFSVVEIFKNSGINPTYIDMANSPAAVAHPFTRGNMVRLGGILYGLGGDVLPAGIEAPILEPVMSIATRIALLKTVPRGETIGYGRTYRTDRDSVIATIPLGYADGLPRALSNKGMAIIRSKSVPIVGRVSMDWTMIDTTEVLNISPGDEVIIIGESGGERITAESIARQAGTISYEITCSIAQRVPRRFV